MKKMVWVIGLLLFSALACNALSPNQPGIGGESGATGLPSDTTSSIGIDHPTGAVLPPGTAIPTHPSVPSVIALPTDTPLPAVTPLPIDTLAPTSTVTPTPTPSPTPTPTTPPIPLVFSGSGAKVLEIKKWAGPAIARLTHSGQSYFQVEAFDAGDRHIDFIVDGFGDYSGTVPVDFEDTATRRLTINADGAWGIQILPLSSAQIAPIPGPVAGKGDLVFFVVGATPDIITVDASQASGSFIIQAYNHKPALKPLALLVNELAPFTGAFTMPASTTLLAIKAAGPWKLDITVK